jgi:hypothetical protein
MTMPIEPATEIERKIAEARSAVSRSLAELVKPQEDKTEHSIWSELHAASEALDRAAVYARRLR